MLEIKPISLKDANNYIEVNHRHHRKVAGHKFSIAVFEGGCYMEFLSLVDR